MIKNIKVEVDFVELKPKTYEKKFNIIFVKAKDIGNAYIMTYKGPIENIKRMLIFHEQGLENAKELYPEVFNKK